MVNPKNTHLYLVKSGPAKGRMAEGIGCNFLFTNQSSLPPANDKKGWKQVMAALDDLQMGWMRVGLIPTDEDSGWDDRKRAWNLRHPHFRTIKRIGQWAQQRGVSLMFDPFAIPESFRRKGAFFADDPQEYASKLILPVAQFFQKNRLTSFRYLGLLNESIWGPGKEGFKSVRQFYDLYAAVRRVLDENGIGEKHLGLLGPSNLSSWEWPIADFFALGLDPDPLWVGYDQHMYLYNFDWTNENHVDFMSMTEVERYVRRYADYAHKRNKPYFLTEIGNMYCGRLFWGERDFNGPYSHTSLLMDAELIVRGINEGVDGFLRWCFSVRGDRDGRWSFLENAANGMQKTANTYPLYRTLMRAVRPGATVLEASVGAGEGAYRYVFAAAVKNRDGNASLLLINDAPGKNLNVGLELAAPFRGKKLYRTVCDETRKGASLDTVAISRGGEGTLMLTPSSLTVLSLKPLG